jgi:hypothetical protein
VKKLVKRYYPYLPIIGFAIYLPIFCVATGFYPGGSINLPQAKGFSFFHNFLCDVMDPVTKSGLYNPARFVAIVSHLVLSLTMISFFYILPEIFEKRNRNFYLTRYFGMSTMAIFIFMYTSYHDLIVTLTGILGTFALFPFFLELGDYYHNRFKQLAWLCFLLSIVVFFIFETKFGFYYLPFLQKITFVLDACWAIWVSLIVFRKNRPSFVTVRH